MITITASLPIQSMKRISLGFVLLLLVAQLRTFAQETAAGGQAVPPTATLTNQSAGLLTPP